MPINRLTAAFLLTATFTTPLIAQNDVAKAVDNGTAILLERQEGPDNAQWPYEGVYRVKREIPVGYQVGGTGISVLALLNAPGYAENESAQDAVRRATEFVASSIEHPLMSHDFESGYDVRGWGYTYGLLHLLTLEQRDLVPSGQEDAVKEAIRFYLDGVSATEIPENGGWNYARRGGFQAPGPPSPFMTGPTLQALFIAEDLGYDIDDDLINRGINALKGGRTATGSYVYAGDHGARSSEAVPGSVGRMLVAETTLYLAGETELHRVRAAVDAFFVHWKWLDKRRAQNGTHVRPYGVAPYYFYFAHYYAAMAIELLPEKDRKEYRGLLEETIFSVQLEDGTWNDRVFDRSAAYGTAMCMLALTMPDAPQAISWKSNDDVERSETSK